MSDELEKILRGLETEKSGRYEQRTRHKDSAGNPLFINRLIREDSPYLLQHAHNPVNWYSWGAEAFSAASDEDKPIFLSIGYSTCHWCHVMEAESFDNVEIAGLLNQYFVSVKLDREQYPDIDDYYMIGVQLVSGQGGWPMSNFLLPDGRPFFAATYFPPGQFADLLNKIAQAWKQQRSELQQGAERTAKGIQQILQGREAVREIDLPDVCASVDLILKQEDREFGGLGGAPKFPQEPLLYYFLDSLGRERDLHKMRFLDRALTGMAQGGIYDQVAGGFHRYSTDPQWLVPHFEKMLYNQSQLSLLYYLVWRLTENPYYLRVMRQTLDYVLRELQQPEGGFYSATDADSEEQEGLYFVWSLTELQQLLSADELALAIDLFAPSEAGNFEGANILALRQSLLHYGQGKSFASVEARLNPVLDKLLAARQSREAPLRDEKLIVAWSSAMANSLAWAGWEMEEPRYLDAARKAVNFILDHNYQVRQKLFRISLNGEVSISAQLEDYANLCEALITLFDTSGERHYLENAAILMGDLLALFWNDKSGGFFSGPVHDEGPTLARSCSAVDGATFSAYGTAVKCLALLVERRYLLRCEPPNDQVDFEHWLQQAISSASAELTEYPVSHVTLVRAIKHHLEGSTLPIRYGAEGRVRIAARRGNGERESGSDLFRTLEFHLSCPTGFHINQNADEAGVLAPVKVGLSDDEKHWVIEEVELSDKLSKAPIQDGEGNDSPFCESMLVTVTLCRNEEPIDLLTHCIGVELQLQVCTDRECFRSETLGFRL